MSSSHCSGNTLSSCKKSSNGISKLLTSVPEGSTVADLEY